MLPLIPRAGVRVNWRGIIRKDEEKYIDQIYSELMDTASRELLYEMVKKHASMTEHPIEKLKIVSIDALVMTQQDYEAAILMAYRQGMHDKMI